MQESDKQDPPKSTQKKSHISPKRKHDDIQSVESEPQSKKSTASVETASSTQTKTPVIGEEMLTVLDPMIQNYNIYDMEAFYEIMSKRCDPTMTLTLKYLNYTVAGINPVLIFCNISHECYPDAMLKVLERRVVNLVKPLSGTTAKNDIRIEYVCKFYGTIISTEEIALICQEFLKASKVSDSSSSSTVPSESLSTSAIVGPSTGSSKPGEKSTTSASSSSSSLPKDSSPKDDSLASGGGDLISLFSEINQMKLDNLSMNLARFISQRYLPANTNENAPRQASSYIFELVVTFDTDLQKIVHVDMDILAATELPVPPSSDKN